MALNTISLTLSCFKISLSCDSIGKDSHLSKQYVIPLLYYLLGLASYKAMCSSSSVSVVEDNGVYGSISTGTHELAHR